jgi:hypothetical protein
VRRVSRRDCVGGNQVEVFRVRRGAAGPVGGAGQRHRFVETIVLACAIRASASIHIGTPAAARARSRSRLGRRRLIGDQVDINASLLRSNQGLDAPEPVVSPWALTRISVPALSIARKALRSTSLPAATTVGISTILRATRAA